MKTFKRYVSCLLLCSFMSSASIAHAEPTMTPLRPGQPAPYAGVLLSPEALATIVADVNAVNEKIRIEVDRAVGTAKAECEHKLAEQRANATTDSRVSAARINELSKRIEVLNRALRREEEASESTPMYVGMGVASGALAGIVSTLLIVYVSGQLK